MQILILHGFLYQNQQKPAVGVLLQGYPHLWPLATRLWYNPVILRQLVHQITSSKWSLSPFHDYVIKWKPFPCYWPFVRGSHRSPVNSPHKSQWCGALVFSFSCAWINGWVNSRGAGSWRRHRAHYDVIVMEIPPDAQIIDAGTADHIQSPFPASPQIMVYKVKHIWDLRSQDSFLLHWRKLL